MKIVMMKKNMAKERDRLRGMQQECNAYIHSIHVHCIHADVLHMCKSLESVVSTALTATLGQTGACSDLETH